MDLNSQLALTMWKLFQMSFLTDNEIFRHSHGLQDQAHMTPTVI